MWGIRVICANPGMHLSQLQISSTRLSIVEDKSLQQGVLGRSKTEYWNITERHWTMHSREPADLTFIQLSIDTELLVTNAHIVLEINSTKNVVSE